MGVSFTVAARLQVVRGYDAIETGVVFTAATLGILASSLAAEKLARRHAQRTLIMAGFIVTIAGIAVLIAHPVGVAPRLGQPAVRAAEFGEGGVHGLVGGEQTGGAVDGDVHAEGGEFAEGEPGGLATGSTGQEDLRRHQPDRRISGGRAADRSRRGVGHPDGGNGSPQKRHWASRPTRAAQAIPPRRWARKPGSR